MITRIIIKIRDQERIYTNEEDADSDYALEKVLHAGDSSISVKLKNGGVDTFGGCSYEIASFPERVKVKNKKYANKN